RSRKFGHALNRHGLVGSMGKVGAAGDNAAMESFFALLQKNVLDRRSWATRDELRIAIVTWTERTYHRRRRQARLGRLTPIEYETMMKPAVTLAA
ncbi:integrase core domain-containing protein, partial [Kocuria flava]